MGEHKTYPPAMSPRPSGIGAWEPQWLGDPVRYLYTALHRPEVAAARLGVVLVPPLFHEQPRSRRLTTEIASSLAALGLPVMRFDFFGTGDSSGTGEHTDFTSMRDDLTLVEQALRAQTGVERVAVLAFRGGALPVMSWLLEGHRPALVALWEPILDGLAWLSELEQQDADERRSSSRYRAGHGDFDAGTDQQLMGTLVSQQLREDLAGARLPDSDRGSDHSLQVPCWAVLRPRTRTLSLTPERSFALPEGLPPFGGHARMDSALFVSPRLQPVVDALGAALLEFE